MNHEKIIKRDDGSSVRIRVTYHSSFGSEGKWFVEVSTKEKRKRLWSPVLSTDSWSYRKQGLEGRERMIFENQLQHVTEEEIESAMLEYWEKEKPSIAKYKRQKGIE